METTNPKPFVFVLMPFSDDFTDVYEVGIKPACQAAGAYCERVDEQIFVDNILERLYNQISKADIIVAEMSGRNPNVFYETGYAHALNKQVVLLTQNAEDIPFDLKHYPHIVYGKKIALLRSQLETRIRWCIDNPKESLSKIEFNLELYFGGQSYRTDIPLKTNIERIIERINKNWIADMQMDFYNPTNNIYTGGGTVGFITPPIFYKSDLAKSAIRLPNKMMLHILGEFERVLPGGWQSFRCNLYADSDESKKDVMAAHDAIIRVFTEVGVKDFPLAWTFWQAIETE